MDTSAWRRARSNKDLPFIQNPEPGSAQTFNERIEATTPAQKAPPLPLIAGASYTILGIFYLWTLSNKRV
jgi:hypothetical protein